MCQDYIVEDADVMRFVDMILDEATCKASTHPLEAMPAVCILVSCALEWMSDEALADDLLMANC